MVWGRSSVDRAPHSHCGGRGFDSHHLHQVSMKKAVTICGRLIVIQFYLVATPIFPLTFLRKCGIIVSIGTLTYCFHIKGGKI